MRSHRRLFAFGRVWLLGWILTGSLQAAPLPDAAPEKASPVSEATEAQPYPRLQKLTPEPLRPYLPANWGKGREAAARSGAETVEAQGGAWGDRLGFLVRVGILTWLILRILGWSLRRLTRESEGWREWTQRNFILLEGLVWVSVILWTISSVVNDLSPVGSLTILVLVGIAISLAWNPLRDVMAGVVLAAERPFEIGDVVEINGARGELRAFYSRVLELRSESDGRFRIPYRLVLSQVSRREYTKNRAHALRLRLPLRNGEDARGALRLAREIALSSPWAVAGIEPLLRLRQDEKLKMQVELEAYAIDDRVMPELSAEIWVSWEARPGSGD